MSGCQVEVGKESGSGAQIAMVQSDARLRSALYSCQKGSQDLAASLWLVVGLWTDFLQNERSLASSFATFVSKIGPDPYLAGFLVYQSRR